MKDCYRTQYDIACLVADILIDRQEKMGVTDFDEVATVLSEWCADNGYQVDRYEIPDEDIVSEKIPGEDVPDTEAVAKRLAKKYPKEVLDAHARDSLDLDDLIMFPAKKPALDRQERCPEDILREEVETEGE